MTQSTDSFKKLLFSQMQHEDNTKLADALTIWKQFVKHKNDTRIVLKKIIESKHKLCSRVVLATLQSVVI